MTIIKFKSSFIVVLINCFLITLFANAYAVNVTKQQKAGTANLINGKQKLINALNFSRKPETWPVSPITIDEKYFSTGSNNVLVKPTDPRLTYNNVRSITTGSAPGYVKGISADYGDSVSHVDVANVLSVDFVFTGQSFNFLIHDTGYGAKQPLIYIEIDDKLCSADGFVTAVNIISKNHIINVDFGKRIYLKHVKLIFSGFREFGGILTDGASTIAAYKPNNNTRVIVFGDSFTAGGGADFKFVDYYAFPLGELMGWGNTIISGDAGTGYLRTGKGRKKYRDRINDIIAAKPDAVIISGGRNDIHFATPEQVGVEAALFFKEIREALPNCEIVVISPFWSRKENYPIHYSNAIKASLKGIPGTDFIDLGKAFNLADDGTIIPDLIAPDNVHPTPAGHQLLAVKLASAIKAMLKTP